MMISTDSIQFNLSDLDLIETDSNKSNSNLNYLNNQVLDLSENVKNGRRYRTIYMFHSVAADGRGVVFIAPSWGITDEGKPIDEGDDDEASAEHKIYVYLIQPFKDSDLSLSTRQKLSLKTAGKISAMQKKRLQQYQKEWNTTFNSSTNSNSNSNSFTYTTTTARMSKVVKLSQFRTVDDALKTASSKIKSLHSKYCGKTLSIRNSFKRMPTILLLQIPDNINNTLYSNPALRSLSDSFPIVSVPFNSIDNTSVSYPVLAWHTPAIDRAILRFADSSVWINEKVALCKYGNIPLGNIGSDPPLTVADVQFARTLKKNNHLLWIFENDSKLNFGSMNGNSNSNSNGNGNSNTGTGTGTGTGNDRGEEEEDCFMKALASVEDFSRTQTKLVNADCYSNVYL